MEKTTDIKRILICEPLCYDLMHVPINAALIATLLYNSDYKISFLAERGHLFGVRKFLQSNKIDENIDWREIDIPDKTLNNWYRFFPVMRLFRKLINFIKGNSIDYIIFSSVSNVELLCAKIICYFFQNPVKIFVIPHGALFSIAKKQPRSPFKRIISFRNVLKYPESKYFSYIILGKTVLKYLRLIVKTRNKNLFAIDAPCVWESYTVDDTIKKSDSFVRFGFFGVGSKGFANFYKLASDIKKIYKHVEFVLVGFLNVKNEVEYKNDVVQGISYNRISREEYIIRAKGLTYAVWVGSPEYYKYGASGSFLDALSFIKPVIYIRNPFIDHYFHQMGDFGYGCSDLREIYNTINSILERFPEEQYHKQCKNILNGRNIFEPKTISSQLKKIIEF